MLIIDWFVGYSIRITQPTQWRFGLGSNSYIELISHSIWYEFVIWWTIITYLTKCVRSILWNDNSLLSACIVPVSVSGPTEYSMGLWQLAFGGTNSVALLQGKFENEEKAIADKYLLLLPGRTILRMRIIFSTKHLIDGDMIWWSSNNVSWSLCYSLTWCWDHVFEDYEFDNGIMDDVGYEKLFI